MTNSRILIVEDESIVAKNMQNKLKRLGYDEPAIVSCGEEAIKKAQMRPHPRLVLMDIKLEGNMDGVEAAELIRDRFDIPVVYVTAYADKQTLQRAKKTSPFGYLLKPFDERELHSAVEIALYNHEMKQAVIKSKQWLSATLKSIGDAVITTDINGFITFMNPVAERLTGWKRKGASGRKLTEVFNILNEETREIVEESLTKAIQGGVVVALEEPTTIIAKDGAKRLIDDSAAPIIDDEGNIDGAVLVFREIKVDKQAKNRAARLRPVTSPPGFGNIIGQSEIMCNIFERINQIAKTDASVLIFGETGTGKELIAHAIHSHSLRKDADFVPVDCAAIPVNLLESELFGFEKGTFTGAVSRKYGLLEFANKGTLFLDEISELDLNLQVKLLRVLQERCFRRIGGKKLISVDMRVIAAMNTKPSKAISEGRLRQDLYYRLNVIPINVAPLRRRSGDIPLLVNYFLARAIRRHNLESKEMAPDAMEFLMNYPWPGNVRQLENIIERLVLLTSTSVIQVKDLPIRIKSKENDSNDSMSAKSFKEVKRKHLEAFEKKYFSKLLKYTNYNIAKAARIAGISARTIYRIVDRYGQL